jgi:nitrile hydratase subunit beta
LIVSIAEWEAEHYKDDADWDYYERWLLALERMVLKTRMLTPSRNRGANR